MKYYSIAPYSKTITLLAVVLTMLCAAQVSYADLEFTQDRRFAELYGGAIYATPDTEFERWNYNYTYVQHYSNYSEEDNTLTTVGYSIDDAKSVYDMTFTLSTQTTVTLTGELSGAHSVSDDDTHYAWTRLFSGDSTSDSNLLYEANIDGHESKEVVPINHTVTLPAGEYRLITAAAGSEHHTATSTFRLEAKFEFSNSCQQ
jgi:hypothetical protein